MGAVISNSEKWMETKMDMRWKTMNFSKIQKEWMSNDDFEWNVWCEQQGGDSTNHNGKLNLWLVFRVFVHKRVCTTKTLSSQYLFFNWIVIFYSEQHTCVYVGCWYVFFFQFILFSLMQRLNYFNFSFYFCCYDHHQQQRQQKKQLYCANNCIGEQRIFTGIFFKRTLAYDPTHAVKW